MALAIPFEFTLIGTLLIPVLVLAMLRVNAIVVFLSLCVGQVLVTYVAKDPVSFVAFISPHSGTLSTTALELTILFVPVVLTCVMMVFSVPRGIKSMLNMIPALGVTAMAALLTEPLLTNGLRHTIEAEALWQQLRVLQPVIVGATAFIAVIALWFQRKHETKYEK